MWFFIIQRLGMLICESMCITPPAFLFLFHLLILQNYRLLFNSLYRIFFNSWSYFFSSFSNSNLYSLSIVQYLRYVYPLIPLSWSSFKFLMSLTRLLTAKFLSLMISFNSIFLDWISNLIPNTVLFSSAIIKIPPI